MLGDDGEEAPPKSTSDLASASSVLEATSSQSGGGGAVAVSAMFGIGCNDDVSIGTQSAFGTLAGELGGVGLRVGACKLDVAAPESRGRFFGAAFGKVAFEDDAASDTG